MRILAWIGLMAGGILLGAELLGLMRPMLRKLGVIPVGKEAPPTPVSGVFSLAVLLVLIFLARTFGVGPVLLWVWAVAVGGFIVGFIVNRALGSRHAIDQPGHTPGTQVRAGTEPDDARRSERPWSPGDSNEYVRKKVYDPDNGLLAKYPPSGLCPICSKAFHVHHLAELLECQVKFEERQSTGASL